MQKLNIISTLLLILTSMSIQAQGNFKINPNGDKDLVAVNEYLEAVYSRDPNQIENIHASDVVGYAPRWNSPRTRQQIVDSYNYIWESTSEFRYDRVRMLPVTISGDKIQEYNGNWMML